MIRLLTALMLALPPTALDQTIVSTVLPIHALQGIGGGLIVLTRAIIGDTVPGPRARQVPGRVRRGSVV